MRVSVKGCVFKYGSVSEFRYLPSWFSIKFSDLLLKVEFHCQLRISL